MIEMNKKNKELLNWLETLTEYADGRLSQINNKISNTDDIVLHSIFIIVLAMNYYVKNIKTLIEAKMVLPANILLRSLIEGFINIEYIIYEDSPLRAIAYVFEDFDSREKNVKTYKEIITEYPNKSNLIPKLATTEKCYEFLKKIRKEKEEYLSNFEKKYNIKVNKKDLNFLNVFKRSKKADLKNLYKILYPYLSGLSHMSASGLKDFIKIEGNKYRVFVKESEFDLKNIIETAGKVHFVAIEDLFKKFGIYFEKDFKDFEKVFG